MSDGSEFQVRGAATEMPGEREVLVLIHAGAFLQKIAR